MSKRTEELFERVYTSTTVAEQRQNYDAWAADYDEDVLESGYLGPKLLAQDLASIPSIRPNTVLDVGCGTGLTGIALKSVGIDVIDGVDLSQEMLAQAKKKEVYHGLYEANLNEGLPFPEGLYDAAFSVGVYTLGHVKPTTIPDVMRVVKPGGFFFLTVSGDSWEKHGYAETLAQLEAQGIAQVHSDEHRLHVESHQTYAHFLALLKPS